MSKTRPEDLQIVPREGAQNVSPNRPSLLEQIRSDIQNSSSGMADDLVLHKGKDDLRTKTVLWTWSHTENAELKSPTKLRNELCGRGTGSASEVESQNSILCRQVALIFAEVWEESSMELELQNDDGSVDLEAIVVKPEYHESGKLHIHVLTSATQKTRRYTRLQSLLRSKHTICVFARVSQSNYPFNQLFKYICFPSEKKPLILNGYSVGEIPQKLVDQCEKAVSKFRSRQCGELGVDEFIRKYKEVILDSTGFEDAMAQEEPPALPGHDAEDPILLYRFKQVQSWYIKNATKHAKEHVASCYSRIARVVAISWREIGPKEHFQQYEPEECIGTSCQFATAWKTMSTLNDLSFFITYLKLWYSNQLPYGGPATGGRPRNIIFHGQPGCGKSFLETLVLFCIPQDRIFRIKAGSFPFDSAADNPALLVVGSSDFRITTNLDIQQMLLATEGKPFVADSKGKKALTVKGPVSFVMGSNNFFTGPGWGEQDIKALHDRFYIIELAIIPSHMRLKSLPFCTSCAKKFISGVLAGDQDVSSSSEPWIVRLAKRQKIFTDQMAQAKAGLETGSLSPKTYEALAAQLKSEYFTTIRK